MFERKISVDDVTDVVATGESIQDYPDDQPYPSCLLLGWRGSRPLHVVCADNHGAQETVIITAYEPDPLVWEPDFRRKRP